MFGKKKTKHKKTKQTTPKQAFDIVVSIPQEDAVASVKGRTTEALLVNMGFVSLNCSAPEPALEAKVFSSTQTGARFSVLPLKSMKENKHLLLLFLLLLYGCGESWQC